MGSKWNRRQRTLAAFWVGGIGAGVVAVAVVATPRLPTTLEDYYFFGTQPTPTSPFNPNFDELIQPNFCAGCHEDYSGEQPASYSLQVNRWAYSMMGQSYRDPVFQAHLQIAEKDASFSSDTCLRCHAPAGWIQDRRKPPGTLLPNGHPDPQALTPEDIMGVSCIVCHRTVDPVERPDRTDIPPRPPSQNTEAIDRSILAALEMQVNPISPTGNNRPPDFAPVGLQPGGPHAANAYVIDPRDRRRGPVDLGMFFFHQWLESPLHKTSQACAACHDVSNALFTRQPDGSYRLNPVGQAHPTGNKYDMFPMDRLYSEWLMSDFALGPVTLAVPDPNGGPSMVGRYSFDGVTRWTNTTQLVIFNTSVEYTTCQSCHQPQTTGVGCNVGAPIRETIPVHNFTGTNSWVLRAVNDLYLPDDTMMFEEERVDESVQRNIHLRRMASDLELSLESSQLKVRVINQTGHKLPSGFPEGRRMWVNVRFLDGLGNVVAERGAYDHVTATLDDSGTKVYKIKAAIDSATYGPLPPGTNLPPDGPSFHLDLNNKVIFDNRIPPRGFTNAKFAAIQAAPVGYTYADGQYWDDTFFALPPGAVRAEVRLFGQTTTREYVEWLRDNATDVSTFVPQPGPLTWELPSGYNPGPGPLTLGQIIYAQWLKWGKSAPVEMNFGVIDLVQPCNPADIAQTDAAPGPDGCVDNGDFSLFISSFFSADCTATCGQVPVVACNPADIAQTDAAPGPDGCVDNGDFSLFISSFFSAICPHCGG
jgi:hypothetical protein